MAPSSSGFARFTAALRNVGSDASRRLADAIDALQAEQSELELPGQYLLSWVGFEGVDPRAEVGSIEGHRNAPVADLHLGSDERVLTIGYVAEFGVFVGWPAYDGWREWSRMRFPVPYRALREASASGWADPLTSSRAYAFRVERLERFLRVYRRNWENPPPKTIERKPLWEVRYSEWPASPRASEILYGPDYRREKLPGAAPEWISESRAPASRHEVETGLADPRRPAESIGRGKPLKPDAPYLFWFAIGAEREESIELTPMPLPDTVRSGSQIEVVLFSFEDEIEVTGETRGTLDIQVDGRAVVSRAAVDMSEIPGPLSERVLFFAIKTPPRIGEMRLRCNVYLGSTLLQSRLVRCRVGGHREIDGLAHQSTIDYSFAETLDPGTLERVPEHELSLLINGGVGAAGKTHDFRFFAEGGTLEASASLSEKAVENATRELREALRTASWGDKGEWKQGATDRYSSLPPKAGQLDQDLIDLAIKGRRFYGALAGELVKEAGGQEALVEVALKPGRVQIASVNEGLYVPAGLFYDYAIETSPGTQTRKKMKLCDDFVKAASGSAPLEDSPCMVGECPNRDDSLIVCPSGFWGFRHEIGWPVGGGEMEKVIDDAGAGAAITVGVSTDPRLKHRQAHVEKVLKIASGKVAESREDFARLAGQVTAPLVYFYCHGSTAGSDPFLELGPVDSDGLDRSFIQTKPIRWPKPPRPLVFINGCHTTALDPESLGGLVCGFVEDGNAIGVVGTEISLFEPLACRFGLLVIEAFLGDRRTIGKAIRHARLELLREGNPLGLIYVPFVAADVGLTSATT